VTGLLDYDDPSAVDRPGQKVAFGFDDVAFVAGVRSAVPAAMLGHNLYFVSGSMGAGTLISATPPWFDQLLTRVNEISTLAPGWDGHRAPPISHRPLGMALNYLNQVAPFLKVPPSMVPTASGGVALEWHRSNLDLEIEFTPAGEVTVFGGTDSGDELEGPLDHYQPAVTYLLAHLV